MGNCQSQTSESNQIINQQLWQEKKQSSNLIKLLLLGAGESGKSTVIKQMKILHYEGYTKEELYQRRYMVYANILQSMGSILGAMTDLKIRLEVKEREKDAAMIMGILEKKQESEPITEEVYQAVRNLWADADVQKAFEKRDKYSLNDSAKYFLDSLSRICKPDYLPTEQDVLQTRVATMGVIEVVFKMKGKEFRVFDVGGQRSQRKKWIHCFDDVKAVIFVASLSEYDQVLREDNTTNRMQESIQLFKQVCNNRFFVDAGIILFLNKKDLFLQKVEQKSIKLTFPEYEGGDNFEEALHFITSQYVQANQVQDRQVYPHSTCATDTGQIQFVLDSVLDTILSGKLKGCGLY